MQRDAHTKSTQNQTPPEDMWISLWVTTAENGRVLRISGHLLVAAIQSKRGTSVVARMAKNEEIRTLIE